MVIIDKEVKVSSKLADFIAQNSLKNTAVVEFVELTCLRFFVHWRAAKVINIMQPNPRI